MALSGSVSTTKYDGRYYTLSWTAEQSTANNQSTIKWTLKAVGGNSSWYAERDLKVIIDGATVYSKTDRVSRYTGTVKTGSKTLTHNSSGDKSFTVKVEAAVYTASINCTGSKSFTLNNIPRKATITAAPNFNDEANPKITYSNLAGNSVTTLQVGIYSTDAKTAYAAYRDVSKTGSSYTFNLTTAERDKLREAAASSNTLTVRFYIKTVIGGETFTHYVAKTLTIINATPTLSPTAIEDTNAVTDGGDGEGNITATGSNTRWVKGFSDVRYAFNASAKKGASIKSYSVVCGTKTGSAADGVLYNVDSGSVKFTVTDTRNNTATVTLTRDLVNYIDLTCNLTATAALDTNTTAKATLKISGNFFNGNINTAAKNNLELWYRFKEESGSYGSWIAITPTISGNAYNLSYAVPEALDYQKAYTFQVRARDDYYKAQNTYVTSVEKVVNIFPVFDWGKDNFNFNVPVIFRGNNILYGTTAEGEQLNCFQPCNNNNNCVLGYGGYTNDIGATNIYGNDVNILTNNDCSINDGNEVYSLLGLAKALSNRYNLTVDVTLGGNYSAVEVTAILVGNCIRFYYSFTRKTASSIGNITNDTVATVKVTHNGKVSTIDNVSFINGATGNIASFYTGDVKNIDGNSFSFNIYMSATAAAVETSSGYFLCPVTLNLSAYL